MKQKPEGFKNARYAGIPCWLNFADNELIGQNWFYDKILSVILFIDINLFLVDGFRIVIIDD